MTTPGEHPVSLWKRLRPLLSVVIAVLGGVTYGLFTRLAFGKSEFSDIFTTLSLGFICLTPLALGVITVLLAPPDWRNSWLYVVLGPWLGTTIFMLLVAAFTLEAWICILMAVPVFWVMGTIGGVVTRLALVEFSARNQTGMMGLLALTLFAPYVVTPIEQTWPAPDSFRRVESSIEINAEPAAVWANITRFPRVSPAETRHTFFSLAGLPRPLEATLTTEDAGAIRRGEWEYGLAFVGTITDWQPERGFTLTLEADAGGVRGAPLPLGDIGGRYFDVVDDQYVIERLGAGRVRLHLISTHRLSTHFNAYGGLWTDLLMRDLQHYILDIVKARSEAQ